MASVLTFGQFRVDLAQRQLWLNDQRLPLGARAFAILAVLLEAGGDLVPKAQLFARGWPGVSVDEGNLRVQISALRKALGPAGTSIQAEAGLGYRFTGLVTPLAEASTNDRNGVRRGDPADPLGRDDAIDSLETLVKRRRLVTLVGPGGIGKTTVALAVSRRLRSAFPDGVVFIEFGSLQDPALAPVAIATALARTVGDGDPLDQVLIYLEKRQALLVLDCCEHVVDMAASMAERIIAAAPDVHILITSREVLRVAGEVVERLGGLAVPSVETVLEADVVATFPAIQLFVRIAQLGTRSFVVAEENLELLAQICRRLDGMPLAIELAAGMSPVLSLREILTGLDERFELLTLGRRTALPRHRTLAATMAWSYDLLPESEKAVLRRLAVFTGRFTMDAAVEVAGFERVSAADARQAVLELANKSLLNVELQIGQTEFRLLETTRAYALQAPCDTDTREEMWLF